MTENNVFEATDAQITEAIETAVEALAPKAEKAPKELTVLTNEYAEDGTAEGKLLDAVYVPFNDLIAQINSFKSMGDLDTLSKNEIENASDDSELGQVRNKLAAMKAKVAETERLQVELSRAKAAEKLDPNFDELKARTAIKELRAHTNEMFKVAFSTFEVLGHVETVRENPLKAAELVALDDIGEALLLAQNTPNIKGTKGTAPQGDSRTTVIREWAWANGHEVADRGRISADIVAAYDAAHSA